VLEVLGAVDHQILGQMTDAVAKGDSGAILQGIDTIYAQGRDPQQFVTSWMEYLRGVLLYRVMGREAESYVTERPEVRSRMEEQAKQLSPDQLTYLIQELARLSNQLRTALQKRILLETGLLSLARGQSANPSSDTALSARLDQLEARLEALGQGAPIATAKPNGSSAAPKATPNPSGPREAASRPAAEATGTGRTTVGDPLKEWKDLRKTIIKEKGALYILNFMQLTQGSASDELVLRCDKEIYRQQLEAAGGEKLRFIEEKIREATGRVYHLRTGEAQKETDLSMDALLAGVKNDIHWT
jgi:DNA polymerase-3 subunit gamma/tau